MKILSSFKIRQEFMVGKAILDMVKPPLSAGILGEEVIFISLEILHQRANKIKEILLFIKRYEPSKGAVVGFFYFRWEAAGWQLIHL